MASFDGGAVMVALPSLSDSLCLSYAQTLWVPAVYLLAVASLLLPAGRAADRRGRASFYTAGLGLFCAGSALAGLTASAWWLFAARCCQGVGGALIVTTSAALATETVPPAERGRALGINTMCVYVGAAAGPPLGGLLVVSLGWRSVFFFSAIVSGVLLAALFVQAPSRLPHRHLPLPAPTSRAGPASLLLAVGLAGVLLPLTFGPLWRWTSWRVSATLAVAVAALALFALHERYSGTPLVPRELYRGNRLFTAACTAALLTYTGVYGIPLLAAVHLQVIEGLGADATGAILLIQPMIMACLAPLAGRLYDRVASRGLTTAGALVMAFGALVLATTGVQGSRATTVLGLAIIGLGLALFSTPNISAVLGSVTPERLSVASAVLGTNRFIGQALSVGLLGAIAAAHLGAAANGSLTSQIGETSGTTAFASGYRWAMVAGALVATAAAAVSATRGRQEPHGVSGTSGDTLGSG